MSATPPLADSLALAAGREPSRCGFDLCRHILLGVRESKAIRPDLVVKYGLYLLQTHASSLSHELWAAYEQVYIALLQRGRYRKRGAVPEPGSDGAKAMERAQEVLDKMLSRFPDSLRVKRLEGMMWEAKGEPDLAMAEYEDILQDDPSHLLSTKRQVALLRSKGKLAEAGKRLVEYLGTFCSDMDAWVLLHELYLQCQQHKRAAFCLEELVLINPMNYIYHVRAGEIAYTMGVSERSGSHEQLLTARKYFAHALELKPDNNLRALYGILLVCAALGSASSKSKAARGVDNQELLDFIKPQLIKCYTPAGSGPPHPMRPLVTAMLQKLLSPSAAHGA